MSSPLSSLDRNLNPPFSYAARPLSSSGLLLNGSPGSIKGQVHERGRLGVGVGNRDAPKLGAANLVGCLAFLPFGVIEPQVRVSVAVRDAIDGDRLNIGLMVEAVLSQQAIAIVGVFAARSRQRGCCRWCGAPCAVDRGRRQVAQARSWANAS